MHAFEAYATTQRETAVASARSIDLLLLVYERLLEHLRVAEIKLREGSDAGDPIGRALDLITMGLQACLDSKRGGEIAANLAAIYDWANREILLARLKREADRVASVIEVIDIVADAWRTQASSVGLSSAIREAVPAPPLNDGPRQTPSPSIPLSPVTSTLSA